MGPKGGRKCVVCGRKVVLTKEHVMPQWIWREVHGANPSGPTIRSHAPSKYRETVYHSLKGVTRSFEPRSEQPLMRATSITVRAVCRDCNNGWMARLEDEVKPILMRVNRDRTWSISTTEVSALRRWVVKTSLMLEQADADTTLADLRMFEAIMLNQPPPGSWYIGLGRAAADIQFKVMSSPVAMQTSVMDDETGLPESTTQQIFGMEHILTPWELIFILRYSPHVVVPPARLDHDLIASRRRRRRPIQLESLTTGVHRLNNLPLFTRADLDPLLYWGHAHGRRRSGGLLLGRGSDGTPAIFTPQDFVVSMSDEYDLIGLDQTRIDVTQRQEHRPG